MPYFMLTRYVLQIVANADYGPMQQIILNTMREVFKY